MENEENIKIKDKYACPYCGMDITKWISEWIRESRTDSRKRDGLRALIESIKDKVSEDIRTGREKDYDDVDYEELEKIYKVKSSNGIINEDKKKKEQKHTERVGDIQKAIQKMQDGLGTRKRQTEKQKNNIKKCIAQKKENLEELLKDEKTHEEFIRRTTACAVSMRNNIAYEMYALLITEATQRNADKLFLYKQHSRKVYKDIYNSEDVLRIVQKYKKLRSIRLFCKKFQLTDDTFVCGLFYMPTERCVASIAWILGVDITGMFEDVDIAYDMVKQLKLDEMKKLANNENQ